MNEQPLVAVDVADAALRKRLEDAVRADGLRLTAPGQRKIADSIVLALPVQRSGVPGEVPKLPARVPCVLVVAVPSDRAIRRATRAGVQGIVLESDIERALAVSVRAVIAGQICLPNALKHQAVKPKLTAREKQVLGMIVLGMTNAEIADRLHVTESTVKSHLATTFAKLGVSNRSEAAAAVLDPEGGLGTGILHIIGAGDKTT